MSLGSVARGDFSQRITVLVHGVVTVQLKDLINTMIRTICKGGHSCISRSQKLKAKVTKTVALGDLIKQFEADAGGEILDLKNTINGMVVRLRALAAEVARVTLELGSQSKLGGQVHVSDVEGNVVEFGAEHQVRSIAVVTTAVARGDLTQKVEIFVKGEMSTLEGTANFIVVQLSAFASEVRKVPLEVGRQGILGGQARVEEITKTIALTSSSTLMFEEMLDLKMTVSFMVAQLSALANKVTRIDEFNIAKQLTLAGSNKFPLRSFKFGLRNQFQLDIIYLDIWCAETHPFFNQAERDDEFKGHLSRFRVHNKASSTIECMRRQSAVPLDRWADH
ncbi:hypothetical protein BYT27DRAFT_7209320 [Phlegmacium glaucopus]|nr:hypothetical protein BYT27DRAFT_7209320 [Phlegmacium glaucopus]